MKQVLPEWWGEVRACAHMIVMKNMEELSCWPLGAACRPKASVSVSKHCVPVQTVLRCRVSSTSWTPGRCGPFWQTQFIKSSHEGICERQAQACVSQRTADSVGRSCQDEGRWLVGGAHTSAC